MQPYNVQLLGLNHKEANCIPRELVRYSSATRPILLVLYLFTMASQYVSTTQLALTRMQEPKTQVGGR